MISITAIIDGRLFSMGDILSKEDLKALGFEFVGKNVQVSALASFYGCSGSRIGDNSRIDDFCSFKGRIELGRFVHIASFCILSGIYEGIEIDDFSGVSSNCSFWTSSENFIVPTLTSPALDKSYSSSNSGGIRIGKAVKIGASCQFLPGAKVHYGASIAATCIVDGEIEEGAILAPKHRHNRVYGHRDVEKMKKMEENFWKERK